MNRQSAAKHPIKDESSTTISRKESTILSELEKVNAITYKLSDRLPDVGGVYGIYNTVSDKIYIGSAMNVHKRKVRHLWYLNHNCHHSSKLQRSYNRNKDKFLIFLISITTDYKNTELYWINKLNSFNAGFNSTDKVFDYKKFKLTTNAIAKVISKSSIPVLAIGKDNKIKFECLSVADAAKLVNTSSSNISRCCQGKFTFIKGYKFVYKSEYKVDVDYSYKAKRVMSLLERQARSKLMQGRKQTIEHRRNLAIVQGHAISKIDTNTGKVIQQYISIREAERENNLPYGTLQSAMKYKQRRRRYVFKYSKDIV